MERRRGENAAMLTSRDLAGDACRTPIRCNSGPLHLIFQPTNTMPNYRITITRSAVVYVTNADSEQDACDAATDQVRSEHFMEMEQEVEVGAKIPDAAIGEYRHCGYPVFSAEL